VNERVYLRSTSGLPSFGAICCWERLSCLTTLEPVPNPGTTSIYPKYSSAVAAPKARATIASVLYKPLYEVFPTSLGIIFKNLVVR
jgi:hypothetical protein